MTMQVSEDLKNWKYARLFLDTSALLKLLVPEFKEKGTENLRAYIEAGIKIHTSEYCIGEVLGILKRKWISNREALNLSTDGYLIVINRLNWKIDNKKLIVHDIPLSKFYSEAIELVKKYNIDYVDSILLSYTLSSEKVDLFVTADADLSKAAIDKGALYWNIIKTDKPDT